MASVRRSHIGSALSLADLLAVLYFASLRLQSCIPAAGRDRLILSKGHGALALYAILHEAGYIGDDVLGAYGEVGNPLAGHPSSTIDGVEVGTGALGHGLAIAAGLAEAARMDCQARRVAVVLGDGEQDEGSVWEAALFCGHRKLSKLVAIIDRNGLQQEGLTEDILALEPLADKWRAFGWDVLSIDGHDIAALYAAFADAETGDRPVAVIAQTIKGKGVSFMERNPDWHMALLEEPYLSRALMEVGAS